MPDIKMFAISDYYIHTYIGLVNPSFDTKTPLTFYHLAHPSHFATTATVHQLKVVQWTRCCGTISHNFITWHKLPVKWPLTRSLSLIQSFCFALIFNFPIGWFALLSPAKAISQWYADLVIPYPRLKFNSTVDLLCVYLRRRF